MPVTRDDVFNAYRFLLGREPESELAIDAHLMLDSVADLRNAIMNSQEFRAIAGGVGFTSSKWVCTDVLGCYAMWVDLHDRYVSRGCLHDDWEPEETSYFRSKLFEGATVIDIGANVGWFSLLAAKHVGHFGEVHAFEPRPGTLSMLRRTIAQNRLQSIVRVWEYALGKV